MNTYRVSGEVKVKFKGITVLAESNDHALEIVIEEIAATLADQEWYETVVSGDISTQKVEEQ
jgi:hypothetical protein